MKLIYDVTKKAVSLQRGYNKEGTLKALQYASYIRNIPVPLESMAKDPCHMFRNSLGFCSHNYLELAERHTTLERQLFTCSCPWGIHVLVAK